VPERPVSTAPGSGVPILDRRSRAIQYAIKEGVELSIRLPSPSSRSGVEPGMKRNF